MSWLRSLFVYKTIFVFGRDVTARSRTRIAPHFPREPQDDHDCECSEDRPHAALTPHAVVSVQDSVGRRCLLATPHTRLQVQASEVVRAAAE